MDKAQKYETLIKQIDALIDGEKDKVANLSNIVAAIKETHDWFWIGFYLVKNDQLVLGPFQGPVACTRIGKGKGVCGTAWAENRSLLVPDVHEFPGHIACSTLSRSEIVVPVNSEGEVVMVLDVDSNELDDFTEEDRKGLEKIGTVIGANWQAWD